MSGLQPSTTPRTAQQIAAQLVAIGFTQPQADTLTAMYRSQQLIISTLNDLDIELPEELLRSLDDFDPDDDQSSMEGIAP